MSNLLFKKLEPTAVVPTRGSKYCAGYDLSSIQDYTLMPMERKLFRTGLSVAIPEGLYGRIAPRSGLSYKDGIDVMAGVIDSDYRGEVCVLLINLGRTEKQFKVGDKVAQIIFENYTELALFEVAELPETNRGDGGFGSTDREKVPAPNPPEKVKVTLPPKLGDGDIVEIWKEKIAPTVPPHTTYEMAIKEREKR